MNDYLVTLDNDNAVKRAEYLGMNHRYYLDNGTIQWFRDEDDYNLFKTLSLNEKFFDRGCRRVSDFIGQVVLRGLTHISLFYYEEQWWGQRKPIGPWLLREMSIFPRTPVRIYRSATCPWWDSVTIYFDLCEDNGLIYPTKMENPMADLIHHRV